MKKSIWAILILFVLAGCSARAVPPSQTAVPTAKPTLNFESATLAQTEQGQGHKAGIFAASFGNTLYYFDQESSESAEDDTGHSLIYKKDLQTGQSEVMHKTAAGSHIYQLFTDEAGNLYYCLTMADNYGNTNNGLYACGASGDALVSDHVDSVARVDANYIYFFRDDIEAGANEEDALFAYRLSDKKVVKITNPQDIVFWEDQLPLVQWEQTGSAIRITVNSRLTKQTKTVDIPKGTMQINPADSDQTGSYFAYEDSNTLVLFVSDVEAEKTSIYRIDLLQSKLLSTKKVNGSVEDCSLAHNGKLYFYAYQCPNEKMINQAVYSYGIADGSLQKLMGIKDSEECEKIYTVETEANMLFVYSAVDEDDATLYDLVNSIPIQ